MKINVIKLNISNLVCALLLLAGILIARNSQAHDVWIEDTPDHQLVIHFGEFGEELETSPGYLDSLSQPKAWTGNELTNSIAFEIQQQTNAFLLVGSSVTNFAAAETDYEVLSATNKPSRKPMFYARWQPVGAGPGIPALTLDLVPTGKPGDIRLYFRGKPVAGETISAHGPQNFEKQLVTDAEGRAHFDLATPGFYLLTCNHHRETVAGFSGGRSYDLVSHNASLTLRIPETAGR